MNIGSAAAASGVSAKMIRHYERIGLIRPADRGASGYRQFAASDLDVLSFVKRARMLGFGTREIKRLLALWQGQRPSAEVKGVALAHIADLDTRIAELEAMRDTLRQLADRCHGDASPACPILDNLAC